MHEIFVNYRTGDAQHAAAGLADDLSRRFGQSSVFFASASIGGGREYGPDLLDAARRCRVLLALIGPDWFSARDASGMRAVDREQDWPRREIVEALHHDVRVIPVMLDGAPNLATNELPVDLAKLADCQHRRIHYRSREQDIQRIIDDIVRLVPGLADSAVTPPLEPGSVRNSVRDASGMTVQARDIGNVQNGGTGAITGHIGTFVNEASGPLHTGSGNQFNDSTFSGAGLNFASGGHETSIEQHVGDRRDRRSSDESREQR
jgi:hypothetical protein